MKVILNDRPEDEDAIKPFKANITEILETNFLISCNPIIDKTYKIFKILSKI